jgi:hypothetical protein
MATYKVRSAGKIYDFQGPDGLPPDAVKMLASDYFSLGQTQPEAPPPEPKGESGFIPSVKRGFGQLGILAGDVIPAMAAHAVGAEDYAKKQMQEAAKSSEELAKKYPAEIASYKNIKGFGDAFTYAKEAVGEALPTMIPSLFTGGAATIAGRGAIAAATSAAENAVLAGAAKGVVGEELKQLATKAGVEAARKVALKYEVGGALAGSAAQNIPDVYQNIYEKTGKQDLGAAFAAGSFNAALDAITPINLLRKAKMSGIPSKELGAAWAKRMGKGALEGFVTEGGTEALQEASSIAAENFVAQNSDFFTKANFERMLEAGLKGGLGGAGITGATNVAFGKGPEKVEPEAIKTSGLGDTEVPEDVGGAPALPPPPTPPSGGKRTVEGFGIEPAPEQVTIPPAVRDQLDEILGKMLNIGFSPAEALEALKTDNANPELIRYAEEYFKQLGAGNAGKPDAGTSGAGAGVGTQPSTKPPTGVAGTTKPDGVVPTKPDANVPPSGKGKQPGTLGEGLGLATIPYETSAFGGVGKPLVRSSGESNIIDYSGRKIVLMDVNGVQVPYYLSTGSGGKVDVPAGKWYPFFGIGKDGWINKTGGKEMAGYYGSPALRKAGETLDKNIGDIRGDDTHPRVSSTGSHIDAINTGFNPAENGTPETLATVRGNIDKLLAQIKGKPSTVEENKPAVPADTEPTSPFGSAEPPTDTTPPVGFTPDDRVLDDYEGLAEVYNKDRKSINRKMPDFKKLSNEQKERFAKASLDEQEAVFDRIAEELHGKAETYTPDRMREIVDTTGDGEQALKYLANSSVSDTNKVLAGFLHNFFSKTKLFPTIETELEKSNTGHAGTYTSPTHEIKIVAPGKGKQSRLPKGFGYDTEETTLHEFTHAATKRIVYLIKTQGRNAVTPQQYAAYKHLESLRDTVKAKFSTEQNAEFRRAMSPPDAAHDIDEFIAWGMTNAKFKEALRNVKIKPENSIFNKTYSKVKDAFDEFVKTIAQLLGMPDEVSIGKSSNAQIELVGSLKYLLSTPLTRTDMLKSSRTNPQTTTQQQTVTAPSRDESKMTDKELADEAEAEVQIKERTPKSFFKDLFSKRGMQNLATAFVSDRYPLKVASDKASLFGILRRFGDGVNDVWGQITTAGGKAVFYYDTVMRNANDEVSAAVEAYAAKTGLPLKEALSRLHIIMEAKHEGERRFVHFLKNVPLDDLEQRITYKGQKYSAAAFRAAIMKELAQPAYEITPDMTEEQIDQLDKARREHVLDLRSMLETVVADKSFWAKTIGNKLVDQNTNPAFDQNSPMYNVIADRTTRQIEAIKRQKMVPGTEAEVQRVSDSLKKVHELTKMLNKRANYQSQPSSNVIDFYDFKNYVPFKGKPGFTTIDSEYNMESRRLGGDMQEGQDPFGGRKSESENPILQSQADGAMAAMRLGRKDLVLAIKNAIKDGIIKGTVKEKEINFEDRFLGAASKEAIGGPNKIFMYNEDGTIDVLEVHDKTQLEAIRRSYRTASPLLDMLNGITSGIGQTHTRYNPAFAPMNFVRDALTNAFNLGADFGPAKSAQLLAAISSDVAGGGMGKSMRFSNLYSKGKFDEIERLAATDKYYADLLEYTQAGGRVSYLEGLAAKGALDNLIKEVGRSGILQTKDQIDRFIDVYNDVFELSSRAATYRMLKDQFFAENKASGKFEKDADALADAKAHAVEYAKNLANFEQVGKYGKEAGAIFMFFRPAAIGAARAIESLAPAFGFNEERFREEAVAEGRTPDQIDKAVKEMQKKTNQARVMAMGLTGMGVGIYMMALMMAGDDDQGRNKVATDDMARWTRYARFHIPGTDIIIQIPWGYGLGAFASAGAQIAAIGAGKSSVGEAFGNIVTTGMDSFLPLPVSRINWVDNFPAAAMDTVTPSMFRPFFEYVMNLDSLGREIYNNRQSKYGDAYTGGDSIPEMYKQTARALFDATNGAIDWSPNTMYFFASNYADGMAKMASSTTNLGLSVTGQKEFDLKNDVAFVSSFVGSKSNIDAREFSSIETQIKTLDKRINSLKDRPEQLKQFMESNPTAYGAVQFYNSQINGALKNIRTQQNVVRASKDLTIMERKAELEKLQLLSNMVKHRLVETFDILDIKP